MFHLAAQSLVRASYQDPIRTYETNVLGTARLLEAVRACGSVRAVVIVTTDKCYENQEWVWAYRENDPLGGHDPYSNSKACAEFVTSAYRNSFFSPEKYAQHKVAIATARAGNVIGGGDWASDRLIVDIVRAFASGETLRIRNPTRPGPGSMCWSRCAATSLSPSISIIMVRSFPAAGISVRTTTTQNPFSGLWSTSPSRWATPPSALRATLANRQRRSSA